MLAMRLPFPSSVRMPSASPSALPLSPARISGNRTPQATTRLAAIPLPPPAPLLGLRSLNAQSPAQPAPAHAAHHSSPADRPGVGDTLDTAPALADLSPAFKRPAVAAAMRKVADWQLQRAQPDFN